MMELFELTSVYEVLLETGGTIRPVRIEIFRSRDNETKLRARIWEQNTYNLYPTFANIPPQGGLENRFMSCDQLNREISDLIAETPDIILGHEWDSEDALLEYLQESLSRYQSMLGDKNA